MKFIHTADVHLGASPDQGYPWSDERAVSIWETFERLIDRVREERADFLFISGDLFQNPPGRKEVERVGNLFAGIPDTKVVLCAGNHDYITENSAYLRCAWPSNVTGLWGETVSSVAFPQLNMRVYGRSYHKREEFENRYAGAKPEGSGQFHILLLHGGDASHCPLKREQLEKTGFDYIALGHIHKPGIVVRGKAAYCGALCPLDKADTGAHGYISGTLTPGAGLQLRFVPFSPYQYRELTVEAKETDTMLELERRIKAQVQDQGLKDSYRLRLAGHGMQAEKLDLKRLWKEGCRVLEIEDATAGAVDYAALAKAHPGTMLELFIKTLLPKDDEISRIALEEGTAALQGEDR